MFGNFLTGVRPVKPQNDSFLSRRADERRKVDSCVALLDGKMYPVQNWSMGGVQLAGDERLFSVGQEMEVTLKFKLRNEILETHQAAQVIRKNKNAIGLRFGPVIGQTRKDFQKVMDDSMVKEFSGMRG